MGDLKKKTNYAVEVKDKEEYAGAPVEIMTDEKRIELFKECLQKFYEIQVRKRNERNRPSADHKNHQ